MSRNLAKEAGCSYTAPTPPRAVLQKITTRHVPLDVVCRYVDTSADQAVTLEVPPTR